jgi:sulfite reductase (ferredoxin)
VYAQKQAGYYYVGASVLRGRITSDQLRAAADLAERYAGGELRTTNMQNLVIVNVPRQHVARVADGLTLAGLPVEGSPFRRGIIACTGTEFCKIAITETKSFARWLAEELDERLPGFEQHLKLHITGCPNSCGQHWIADLGLEGKKIKQDGKLVDAYYFCIGGAVGKHQAIARPVGYRCVASEVPDAIERLLGNYQLLREPDENLRQFFARHSTDEIRTFLAGGLVPAEMRDLSPGRVPHGVEG